MGVLMLAGTSSCTDYLDKDPDTDVSATTAFQNFRNFQGFVEEIYDCIPNKEHAMWCTTFNWGEDEIMNDGEGNSHFSHHIDLGDYRNIYSNNQTYWAGAGSTEYPEFGHRTNKHAWYCIRKCNQGLENIDLMIGTKEEKNLILGQLYFFRAWWHHELMIYVGGLPYVDKVLDGTQQLRLPRLSAVDCAKRCAEDFLKAASYLPKKWEDTNVGKQTDGKNDYRINREMALGYAGKALLWAASPLMKNGGKGEMGAGDKTYIYDKELAAEAAETLGTLLTEIESGATPYALCSYDYENILTHEAASGATNIFDDIFFSYKNGWTNPGSVEAIFRGPITGINGTNWNFAKLWGPKIDGFVEHDKIIHMPTANYVNYAYGMANGEPAYVVKNGELVPNTDSGFDPTHPFKDRDPRFYHDIVFDGERVAVGEIDAADETTGAWRRQQYLNAYTGSFARAADLGTRTGYYCQKLAPKTCNQIDKAYDYGNELQGYLPYMRVADIYLMYAEAVIAANEGNAKAKTYSGTGVDAINVLRDRVGVSHVSSKFTSDYKKLMDEVRRERACELAFEGHRWNDLQRWLLLTEAPFNAKMSQEFNRKMQDEKLYYDSKDASKFITVENQWYRENDAREAEVENWHMEKICTRLLGTKHYWFPLSDADVYLYEEFAQNPGW